MHAFVIYTVIYIRPHRRFKRRLVVVHKPESDEKNSRVPPPSLVVDASALRVRPICNLNWSLVHEPFRHPVKNDPTFEKKKKKVFTKDMK